VWTSRGNVMFWREDVLMEPALGELDTIVTFLFVVCSPVRPSVRPDLACSGCNFLTDWHPLDAIVILNETTCFVQESFLYVKCLVKNMFVWISTSLWIDFHGKLYNCFNLRFISSWLITTKNLSKNTKYNLLLTKTKTIVLNGCPKWSIKLYIIQNVHRNDHLTLNTHICPLTKGCGCLH